MSAGHRSLAFALSVLTVGCLQPVSESNPGVDASAGTKPDGEVLFTIHPSTEQLDGIGFVFWASNLGNPTEIPAGNILVARDALFIDGLMTPLTWDGGILAVHSDVPYHPDPNCYCEGWLGMQSQALKPASWLGTERLSFFPHNYDGTEAGRAWSYTTGKPQRSGAFPLVEGSTLFGIAPVRRSADGLCVGETPLRFPLRDGGLPLRNGTVKIYNDVALTNIAAQVEIEDAGARCLDAVSTDGGAIALIGEDWYGDQNQAWRIVRFRAGRQEVETLPSAQLCLPFKESSAGEALWFACYSGRQVTAWRSDLTGSQRTQSYSLPAEWRPVAALSQAMATILAVQSNGGAAWVCDVMGCQKITDQSSIFLAVGIAPNDALLLFSNKPDGGIQLMRYPAERWRR